MGKIHFYDNTNATGSNFYTMDDTPGQSVSMPSIGQNDRARSLKLVDAVPGVVIKVYDHGGGEVIDDWGEIRVLKQVPSCVVPTFQRDYTDPGGVYRQTYHKKDGLDGRVSYIRTVKAPPLQLDYMALGKLFSLAGWNDISGLASRFASQDSDYRIYQPDTAPMLDGSGAITGTIINTQIDNIRGGTDDHCYATIEVGLDGTLTTKLTFTWGNNSKAMKYGAKAAAWVVVNIVDLASSWGPSQVVDLLFKVFAEVARIIKENPNGRLNFNAVVNHSINKIVQSTRGTIG